MSRLARFNCGNGGAQFCQGCYQMEQDDEHGEYVRFEDVERNRKTELTREHLSAMLSEYRLAFARAVQGTEDPLRAGELHVQILDAVFP